MIVVIRNPHDPRRHGHHTAWAVELPERRRDGRMPMRPDRLDRLDRPAMTAPSPRTQQLTGNALHPTSPVSTTRKTC
jgi:hypothetical protein